MTEVGKHVIRALHNLRWRAHQVNYRGYNRAEEHDVNANYSNTEEDDRNTSPQKPIKNAPYNTSPSGTLTEFEGCTDLGAHGNWQVKQRQPLLIPLPQKVVEHVA